MLVMEQQCINLFSHKAGPQVHKGEVGPEPTVDGDWTPLVGVTLLPTQNTDNTAAPPHRGVLVFLPVIINAKPHGE